MGLFYIYPFLHPHMKWWKWRGVRSMTLGSISVVPWIHTPERQRKSQLAMPSLHMAVTICLSIVTRHQCTIISSWDCSSVPASVIVMGLLLFIISL